MTLLITFFVISIFFSFICSILEAVLLSITPSYVMTKTSEGSYTGKLLNKYKQNIDKPLSAILTLNTIAHTVGAIGVGTQAGKVFGEHKVDIIGFSISYESIIAGAMTLAILLLSEIIPKTIGANNWKSLTPFTVRVIRILIIVLAPLVFISELITHLLKKDKDASVFSRADFVSITKVGEQSGAIAKSESKIINNLLSLKKHKVKDVMTPKNVMFAIQEMTTIKELLDINPDIEFSRIPVYNKSKDDITGIVLKDDILTQSSLDHHNLSIADLKRPAEFVYDITPLPTLFEDLLKSRNHLAIAMNLEGKVTGVITQEDLIETVLGMEIMDENDSVEDMRTLVKD